MTFSKEARKQALDFKKKGMSQAEIGQKLGMDPRTVRRIVKHNDNHRSHAKPPGRKRKLTKRQEQALGKTAMEFYEDKARRKNFTTPQVIARSKIRPGDDVSLRTYQRTMGRCPQHFKRKRARKAPNLTDEHKAERVACAKIMLKAPQCTLQKIIWVDEWRQPQGLTRKQRVACCENSRAEFQWCPENQEATRKDKGMKQNTGALMRCFIAHVFVPVGTSAAKKKKAPMKKKVEKKPQKKRAQKMKLACYFDLIGYDEGWNGDVAKGCWQRFEKWLRRKGIKREDRLVWRDNDRCFRYESAQLAQEKCGLDALPLHTGPKGDNYLAPAMSPDMNMGDATCYSVAEQELMRRRQELGAQRISREEETEMVKECFESAASLQAGENWLRSYKVNVLQRIVDVGGEPLQRAKKRRASSLQ
jgi:hypothetical protein